MMSSIDLKRSSGLPSLGTHLFKIVRFSEETGASGPYWRFVIQTQDGEDKGKEMLLQLSLSPQARWKVDEFLDAMKAAKTGKADGEDFVGKMLIGEVIHDKYENRNVAALATMMPYDGKAPKVTRPAKEGEAEQAELPLDDAEDDFPF